MAEKQKKAKANSSKASKAAKSVNPIVGLATALGSIVNWLWTMLVKPLSMIGSLTYKLLEAILKPALKLIWTIIKPVLSLVNRGPIRKASSATIKYFGGAWSEMPNIKWPTDQETWNMAGVVLVFTAALTLLIVVLDEIIGWFMQQIVL